MEKINILVQARIGSSRLYRKVLEMLEDKTVIEHVIERLKRCQRVDNIIVITTTNKEDDLIFDFCCINNIKCYRGSENNVLNRYYQAALISDSNIVGRVTCDCPLIDPIIVDDMISNFFKKSKSGIDYYRMEYFNGGSQSFPDGFDFEMFTFDSLKGAYKNATLSEEKEHVNPYIRKFYKSDSYKIKIKKKYKNLNLEKVHLSLDTYKDLEVLKNIFKNVYLKNKNFTIYNVLEYLNKNPNLLKNNEEIDIFRGKGQKLYEEAKKIIPGGTQLLSKRPEMFLPDYWPAYYQKANGIEVVSLDGVKMKDFSYMGVGACILGYKDKDVNKEVHCAVDRGNMCTLNCPSEVQLTKLLLKIHPWADMARYSRASGEACCMGVRIGRAASKKDKVAFCGYHGWHDWYLASNWNNGNDLKDHLLPGLNPLGVPKVLKDTAFPFNYNKIEELITIVKNHDIGCVIMEPQRSEPPKDNFLQKVRKLCDNHKIILIFDEISSAFRINTGGIHLFYGVIPDMAIFGKSLGNGYPIGAVIGKKEYMNAAQQSFISSTFFTEDIGFTAAIATIKKHQKYNVGNHINKLGLYFQKRLKEIGKEVGIKITVSGLSAFSSWSFDYDNGIEIKTLYIQKMLERKILAKNAFYLSYAHKKNDVDYYLTNIKEVFIEINKLIKDGKIKNSLLGPAAHTGFRRLA
jgi:glutamate-1-semialdehyde 2,1-aminomutase